MKYCLLIISMTWTSLGVLNAVVLKFGERNPIMMANDVIIAIGVTFGRLALGYTLDRK